MRLANAYDVLNDSFARAVAPRKPMRVSEWAEKNRVLSRRASPEPGEWRNARNPILTEIMDCASARSAVRDVVALLPIQIGKSEIEANIIGYTMTENPMPIILALPGEVSMNKIIDQKINPLMEETPAIQRVLVSMKSRESSNRRNFKDFEGGQIYIEHAGDPKRLKSTSAGLVLADEFSSFATALATGDDPVALLRGRTTAFPRYKFIAVGTPETVGMCRLTELWEKSDKRSYHVPCPDCGHMQPLVWAGMHWNDDATECWYCCSECGVVIPEHRKTAMIAEGRWIPENPGAEIRGYRANALYYPAALGLSWLALVHEFRDAVKDPARLKTFVNDRLAEAWEDPALRAVKFNVIAERAEPRPLRPVPVWVCAVTVGVDTQDNRLPVHILGWGPGMQCWPMGIGSSTTLFGESAG